MKRIFKFKEFFNGSPERAFFSWLELVLGSLVLYAGWILLTPAMQLYLEFRDLMLGKKLMLIPQIILGIILLLFLSFVARTLRFYYLALKDKYGDRARRAIWITVGIMLFLPCWSLLGISGFGVIWCFLFFGFLPLILAIKCNWKAVVWAVAGGICSGVGLVCTGMMWLFLRYDYRIICDDSISGKKADFFQKLIKILPEKFHFEWQNNEKLIIEYLRKFFLDNGGELQIMALSGVVLGIAFYGGFLAAASGVKLRKFFSPVWIGLLLIYVGMWSFAQWQIPNTLEKVDVEQTNYEQEFGLSFSKVTLDDFCTPNEVAQFEAWKKQYEKLSRIERKKIFSKKYIIAWNDFLADLRAVTEQKNIHLLTQWHEEYNAALNAGFVILEKLLNAPSFMRGFNFGNAYEFPFAKMDYVQSDVIVAVLNNEKRKAVQEYFNLKQFVLNVNDKPNYAEFIKRSVGVRLHLLNHLLNYDCFSDEELQNEYNELRLWEQQIPQLLRRWSLADFAFIKQGFEIRFNNNWLGWEEPGYGFTANRPLEPFSSLMFARAFGATWREWSSESLNDQRLMLNHDDRKNIVYDMIVCIDIHSIFISLLARIRMSCMLLEAEIIKRKTGEYPATLPTKYLDPYRSYYKHSNPVYLNYQVRKQNIKLNFYSVSSSEFFTNSQKAKEIWWNVSSEELTQEQNCVVVWSNGENGINENGECTDEKDPNPMDDISWVKWIDFDPEKVVAPPQSDF